MDNKTKMSKKFNNPLASGYSSIFGETSEIVQNTEPNNISVSELFPFGYYDEERSKMHIFTPYTSEKLDALAKDIKENGLLQPLLVRKRKDNEYEVLAGHNRLRASKQANLETVPCIVKECNDDEAIIIMTSTNLYQREEIPPCQKGKAYKLNLEAMNRQGKRNDLSENYPKENSAKLLSQQVGTSVATIYRLVRLSYLVDEFQELVDTNTISSTVGENLSYLTPITQQTLLEVAKTKNKKIDLQLSESLKEHYKNRDVSEQELRLFLYPPAEPTEAKPKALKPLKIEIGVEVMNRFFKEEKPEEIQTLIVTLLEEHFSS